MIGTRLLEVLGMVMIGEGLLAVLNPQGHIQLWRRGPRAWEALVDPFLNHPDLIRCLGAAEAGLGLWLATRQITAAERA